MLTPPSDRRRGLESRRLAKRRAKQRASPWLRGGAPIVTPLGRDKEPIRDRERVRDTRTGPSARGTGTCVCLRAWWWPCRCRCRRPMRASKRAERMASLGSIQAREVVAQVTLARPVGFEGRGRSPGIRTCAPRTRPGSAHRTRRRTGRGVVERVRVLGAVRRSCRGPGEGETPRDWRRPSRTGRSRSASCRGCQRGASQVG